jgi:hypothetical protein
MCELCILSFLYRGCIVMDGNFKADHCVMQNEENDVAFGDDTESYFVGAANYKEHTDNAKDDPEVNIGPNRLLTFLFY